METSLGLTFTPEMAPARLPELAQLTEAAGLDELWVWEDCFAESGVTSAAVALARTERIRVGISLMPVALRTVALTAMEISTLAGMFPGRFRPGIGHGVQAWMGQAGVRVDSPMTLLEEYAVALRSLLAGEEVSSQGRYVTLDQVKLAWPPDPTPELLMGGFGPRTLELSARLGDEVMLAAARTPEEVAEAGRLGAAAAGRPVPLLVPVLVATGDGAAERVARESTNWRDDGQSFGAAGDAAEVAATLQRLVDLGARTLCLQATADEPDIAGLARFLGEEVRPLLRST